jgi:hypothetical protein
MNLTTRVNVLPRRQRTGRAASHSDRAVPPLVNLYRLASSSLAAIPSLAKLSGTRFAECLTIAAGPDREGKGEVHGNPLFP